VIKKITLSHLRDSSNGKVRPINLLVDEEDLDYFSKRARATGEARRKAFSPEGRHE